MEALSGAQIDLLVAALDLKLVTLLRQAMNGGAPPAGLGAGGCCGPGPCHVRPAAVFEPRPVLHPTPRFAPRPVFHPMPRFEPRPVIRPRPVEPPPAVRAPVEPEHPRIAKLPFQPPWKVMPWEQPAPPAPKVKVARLKPDIVRKGTLIDFFL